MHTHTRVIEVWIERAPMGESLKKKKREKKKLSSLFLSNLYVRRSEGKEETSPGMLSVLC